MGKFYLGQPVKIVRDNTGENPELIGIETHVIGLEDNYPINYSTSGGEGASEMYYGYQLDASMLTKWYEYLVCAEDEIEPIMPAGLEAPEKIEALYEPELTEEDIYVLSRP